MDNKTKVYIKGYKQGYNNPSQFDQAKLLKYNNDMAKGVIAGICQRKQDDTNNTVIFK